MHVMDHDFQLKWASLLGKMKKKTVDGVVTFTMSEQTCDDIAEAMLVMVRDLEAYESHRQRAKSTSPRTVGLFERASNFIFGG